MGIAMSERIEEGEEEEGQGRERRGRSGKEIHYLEHSV